MSTQAPWNSISQTGWFPFLKRGTTTPVCHFRGNLADVESETFQPGVLQHTELWGTWGKSHPPLSAAAKLFNSLSNLGPSDDKAHLWIHWVCFLHSIGVGGNEDLLEVFMPVIWLYSQLRSAARHHHHSQCAQGAILPSWVAGRLARISPVI